MALELYVHIPFCVKKCGYCDFVSAPAADVVQDAYVKALLQEIQSAGQKDQVSSIFIGGGTPSIIKAEHIEAILSCIRQEFAVEEDAEVTLEANPGTLTAEKLAVYRRAGINRLSIGLQSANDEELALLGRIHTFREFQESYRLAREAGFQNINVDLMAALPYQTEESFERSLRAVTELSPAPPEHISVYSLIIEEGTPFYEKYHSQAEAREAGSEDTAPLPTEEEERTMYRRTRELLEACGYERYEISNYARPGFACRHNVGYWTGVPYLGFGISSSSYIGGKRFSNGRSLRNYLTAMEEARPLETIRRDEEIVKKEQAMEEFMFLGLRLMRGVSEMEFERRFGRSMEEVYGTVLETMEKRGLMEMTAPATREKREERIDGDASQKDRLWHLTEEGIDVSNYVMAEFLL